MKIGRRPEPVSVAIGWDEVWLEVICLTNSEIAGSPRNIFRYSLKDLSIGVEHWIGFVRLWREGLNRASNSAK